jgi:hypothetical protein
MRKLQGKLTYANVVATLALFLVLAGGTTLAATQLAKNSVGTKQLKNDAVTSAKVKDGSLLAGDFQAGQLPAGQTGPEGEKGAPGQKGEQGETASVMPPEAVNLVGAEGQPGFEEGAENLNVPFTTPVGFWKDHECTVHLQGVAAAHSSTTIFTLPPEFRPELNIAAAVASTSGEGLALIYSDGQVEVESNGASPEHLWGLDGVTFRAAGC